MHPSLKANSPWLLALGLAIGACNVFNPSGEGDGGDTAEAQLTEGERYFREQDFAAAMASFGKVIAQDSTNSLAYYGYAKSVMRHRKIGAGELLNELDAAQEGKGIPFTDADDVTLTGYLKASASVRAVLGKLTLRDTLTRWWRYSQDPSGKAASKDANSAARIAFIKDYLAKAEAGVPGYYRASQFPLSDLAIGYDKVIVDFGLVEVIYSMSHLRDLNGDDSISSADDLIKKLAFNTEDGFKVENLKDIQADLADSANRQNMNNLIQNVASGLNSASNVLDLLSPALAQQGGGQDTAGLSEEVTENMDSVISSLGDAITFYQFGDARDNDGDGCVDEEIMDGKDNDADGFTDEDARILPADDVDNDRNGKQGAFDPEEFPNSNGILLYTVAAGFTKGSGYLDKALRIAVQKDSLSAKTVRGQILTAGEKTVLNSAKTSIGGCWNNY